MEPNRGTPSKWIHIPDDPEAKYGAKLGDPPRNGSIWIRLQVLANPEGQQKPTKALTSQGLASKIYKFECAFGKVGAQE